MHSIRNPGNLLVFPHAENAPSRCRQRLVDRAIPGDVTRELLPPVVPVRTGLVPVDRAGVPEAAIYKHDNARSREDDVGADDAAWNAHRQILAEPKASPVKLGAQRKLGSCVTPRVAAHTAAHLGACGMGVRNCSHEPLAKHYRRAHVGY
jgi:hypothetical protein